MKTKYDKFTETLEIDDFLVFAKDCQFKFITGFTILTDDGVEMKSKVGAKNQKLKMLNQLWKQDKKAKQ